MKSLFIISMKGAGIWAVIVALIDYITPIANI